MDAAADVKPGPAGTLDTSFGDSGYACFAYKKVSDAGGAIIFGTRPHALVVGGDDSLLVAGAGFGMLAIRFTRDGKPDATFNAGKGSIDVGDVVTTSDDARGVVVTSSGAIVLAGTRSLPSPSTALFLRLNADGTRDTTYGDPRSTDLGLGTEVVINSIAAMGDKFVVAGHQTVSGKRRAVVARTDAMGALDSTFGSGGVRTFEFAAGKDSIAAKVIVVDGKIVVGGGIEYDTSTGRMAFARFLGEGTPDGSFGMGGFLEVPLGTGPGAVVDIAPQTDGKLAFAAAAGSPGFAVGRLTTSGALDMSFGAGAFVSKFAIAGDYARAVLVQPDGRLVFGGRTHTKPEGVFALERHESDGTYDSTFGSGGWVATSTLSGNSYVVALGRQSDGRIIAAGAGNDGICLARYWP